MWMLLVLVYGLLKGCREIAKKKAMEKNSVMEVLVVYTFISFLMVVPQAPQATGLDHKFFGYIALKSFFIFLAWILSFRSLKKLPVSLYGVLDLSRVLFATSLGIFILKETLNINQIFGLIFVSSGLLLLKFKPKFLKKLFKYDDGSTSEKSDVEQKQSESSSSSLPSQSEPESINATVKTHTTIYAILAIVSCLLNAGSGFMDKILMQQMTSAQLQFWYMLFLVGYYIIYIIATREKIHISVLKNGWVWAMAAMFVIADKSLFIANGMEGSRITVMTLIKQSGCLITILGGRFIFKEKNTGYRLFCAAVIILGIVLGVMK